MESKPVFFDPHGKRSVRMSRLAAIVSSIAAVTSTLFALILCFTIPSLREPTAKAHKNSGLLGNLKDKNSSSAIFMNSKVRKELFAEIARTKTKVKKPPEKVEKIMAGFYAPWEESGLHSLNAYKSHLTHLIPAWLTLGQDGKSIDFSDFDLQENPKNVEVLEIARSAGLRVIPLISNARSNKKEGVWNEVAAHNLLASPANQQKIAITLRDWLVVNNFQGINIDLESLEDGDYERLPGFLNVLRRVLEPRDLRVTTDLEAETTPGQQRSIAGASDWILLMAYDEHAEDDPVGPIASIDWCENVLDAALKVIPPDKIVLGIGNYAYDWSGKSKLADSLSYQEALDTAKGYNDAPPQKVITFDEDSLNSKFTYEDDDDIRHTVWMLDAASAFNQWKSARGYDIRGAGIWALGEEDPGIWSFLGLSAFTKNMTVKPLQDVKFPYFVANEGKGEILEVKDLPSDGERSFTIDPESGLIVGQRYEAYAFPYVLSHSGYVPKKLCITFDDGPDPTFTPKILDALKDLHIPAVFFVVGKNAEEHSNLVQREYDEGNEIGNHTFTHANLGEVGTFRANLEINATQRALETILGKSTTLFRPPYNADSEPSSREELIPVTLAAKLHYLTVGEKIDPQDWNLKVDLGNGHFRAKTPEDIVHDVLTQIARTEANGDEGNIILLHDAGGNRDATVAALRQFVPILQKRGYQFVSVAQLLGRKPSQVMPDISSKEKLTIFLDRVVFGSIFTTDWLLAIGFLSAIWLGFVRLGLITPLALIYQFKQRNRVYSPEYRPTVTVVVAAYNEEAVIARTIASVLGSRYPLNEIIVVDDGSADRTSEAVQKAFGAEPRVKLLQRENGGKAAALNDAIHASTSEIIVSLDADTQLDSHAVERLIRHFQDTKIAAVAGNVKVGNQVNILTQWQAVEYTTSQNIDRRAYALLNSITVVPGAIGAWRKSAVEQAGLYISDTLAEDMDLTWRLRRLGFHLANESAALAYTEAPESFSAFFRQRFRWAYGTLQCLWKHRGALFHNGFFGWFALPTLWLFQILFQAIAPLVDLQLVYSLIGYLSAYFDNRMHPNAELSSLPAASASMAQVGYLYAVFFLAELIAGIIAYRLEREKYGALWWLFLQRFAYRQIMYGVVYKSILRAIGGNRQGWGKIDRKGTVQVPGNSKP